MKKIFYSLIFFFCFTQAQTNRFIYLVKSKSDNANITTSNFYLDISKDSVKYYNRLYYINDSIYKKTEIYGYNGFKLTDFVLGNTTGSTFEIKPITIDVFKIKIRQPENWNLTNEKKTFNGEEVLKATTFYGGRNWVAWFNPKIPIPFGPYIFYGLPGLIVEISDLENNYSFSLIKTEKFPKTQQIEFLENMVNQSIEINNEKYKKIMIDYYKSPFSFLLKGNININEDFQLRLEDGTILTKSELKPAEEKERNKITDSNNPINLDFKIAYPKQ